MKSTYVARVVYGGILAGALTLSTVAGADKSVPPDNTGANAADKQQGQKPTADNSKNGKSDVKITAQIRRSVMADKGLSTSAHNVKIIVNAGMVTLKGPVKSDAEKSTVAKKAVEVVGVENVTNQIEIAP